MLCFLVYGSVTRLGDFLKGFVSKFSYKKEPNFFVTIFENHFFSTNYMLATFRKKSLLFRLISRHTRWLSGAGTWIQTHDL